MEAAMRVRASVVGLALAAGLAPGLAQAELVFGLTADNRIVTFDSGTPGVVASSRAITGLGGDVLTGIDLRPATGGLYSVATNGNLYRLDASGTTFSAILVGNIGVGLTGVGQGIDFNPTVDRLRFVNDVDQNLRINPNSAVAIIDTPIGGGFDIIGSAYTNSFSGALTTTLYGLDAAGDQLLRSTNPNGGVYVAVGPLGVPLSATDRVGFDISGRTGGAYFNVGSQFFTVSLGSGAATLVGSLGSGELVGLTANGNVPEPSAWALMIGGFGLAGHALRARRRTAAA
jgi:hypothetical protein